jgi:dipeptidyl aminopeptidase/acylaminoacyl peptidase
LRFSHLVLSAAVLALAAPAMAQTAPAAAAPSPAPISERRAGNLVLQNVPETPADVRARLVQYQNTRGAGFGGFLPNGGVVITTRFADTAQIHEVRTPLGARRQLTFFPEPVAGVQVRPGGTGELFFGKDSGGDEFILPWRFDRTGGRASPLFNEPRTQNAALTFTDDGAKAAWSITRSGTARRQVVMVDMAAPNERIVLHEADGSWAPLDWSADGSKLLLSNYISVGESRRYVLDVATKTLAEITPDKKIAYDGGVFSADGKSVFLVSDEGSQFQQLVRVDLASGARTVLTPGQQWDVEELTISPDGRTLAYTVNEDGLSVLKLMNARTGRAMRAPQLPPGLLGGIEFSADSRRIGFSFSASDSASDVWTYDLRTRDLVRWTESEVGGLDPRTFVAPELIRYPTFDTVNGAQRTIPAFVYRPRNATGRTPVVIDIHGGPEAQSRPGFNSRIQYWVNELGLTVIVPNVRGSTGYGKDFVGLDNGFKRMDAVKDIGALLDWVSADARLDKDRVVVYGGSYGGFMVLASMVEYNDRLAGGIDIVGISNFVTFLKNTEGYRVDLRRVEYGDERDPKMRAFQESIAPLNNARKITKPLFVIQGANDPRVPRSEAEQMVATVRANGGDVWYMLAMDEGHGFRKKANIDAQREAETLFFRKVFGLTPVS